MAHMKARKGDDDDEKSQSQIIDPCHLLAHFHLLIFLELSPEFLCKDVALIYYPFG